MCARDRRRWFTCRVSPFRPGGVGGPLQATAFGPKPPRPKTGPPNFVARIIQGGTQSGRSQAARVLCAMRVSLNTSELSAFHWRNSPRKPSFCDEDHSAATKNLAWLRTKSFALISLAERGHRHVRRRLHLLSARRDCVRRARDLRSRRAKDGRENIFLDVDNIDPGVDWFEALNERVAACDALVAVIGRNWVAAAACRRTSARRRASISSPPTKETLLRGPISGTSTNLRLAAWQKMSARRQDQRPCSWSVRGQCRRDGTRPAASAGSTSASSRPRTRRCPRAPG
jgi:hypothetical protein